MESTFGMQLQKMLSLNFYTVFRALPAKSKAVKSTRNGLEDTITDHNNQKSKDYSLARLYGFTCSNDGIST
jgi:hypothetical protein